MDASTNKRTTTRAQFQAMVEKMKTFPDIAKNASKRTPEILQDFWKSLKDELNSLGPPVKETSEWKKVWSDHKSALKKKLAHNKRQHTETGGGGNNEIFFTALEEEVIQLVCLREAGCGVTGARPIGVKRQRIQNVSTSNENIGNMISNENIAEVVTESELVTENKSPQMQRTVPKQMKLLETQVNIQQKFYVELSEIFKECKKQQEGSNHDIKKMSRSLDRIANYEKKRNSILQSHLDETKRHNAKMENLAFEKANIKKQLLSLELSRINSTLTK